MITDISRDILRVQYTESSFIFKYYKSSTLYTYNGRDANLSGQAPMIDYTTHNYIKRQTRNSCI